jgi:hypothetical protein
VQGFKTIAFEPMLPLWRKIDIDEQLHADLSSTSRPEASQAP